MEFLDNLHQFLITVIAAASVTSFLYLMTWAICTALDREDLIRLEEDDDAE